MCHYPLPCRNDCVTILYNQTGSGNPMPGNSRRVAWTESQWTVGTGRQTVESTPQESPRRQQAGSGERNGPLFRQEGCTPPRRGPNRVAPRASKLPSLRRKLWGWEFLFIPAGVARVYPRFLPATDARGGADTAPPGGRRKRATRARKGVGWLGITADGFHGGGFGRE